MKSYFFMLRFGWKYAPFYLAATFALAIVHQVVIFFEHTYSIKFIIDTVQYQGSFLSVLLYIGAVFAAVALSLVFGSWLDEYYKLKAKERVHQGLQTELFAQAARLDLADYDDPGHYNEFVRAVGEAPQKFDEMVDRLKRLCMQTVGALSALAFVLFLDPAGFVFAAVGLGLSTFVALRQGKKQFALETETLPPRRKMGYLTRVFALADHAKELRLTPVSERLSQDYDGAVTEAQRATRRHAGSLARLGFLQSFVLTDFFFRGLYLSYLVVRAVVWKQISLGDLVALTGALTSLVRTLQDALTFLPEMQKDTLYVQAIRKFLTRRASVAAPESPLPLPAAPWHLELAGVCFSYPSSTETPILSDVSFSLGAREKVAIVGHNGAGKTTLTKLILRLYDPTDGAILLNGIDIRRFDPEAYRSLIASVFQDFQIFAASVAQNVALDRDGNSSELSKALEQSGFGDRLASLPQGMETPLTREFEENGVNLSGGENQKLALARVFYRDAPAVILDEPSSALDPVSEYRLNQNMTEASRDRSVVYISHRLSSTRMADRILLLEHGRLVEQGTHDELIALGGRYAQMFQMQSERYKPPV